MDNLRPPNLFRWAKSELSQDAFLCWLLEWSNVANRSHDLTLHELGVHFVKALLRAAGLNEELAPAAVEVRTQVHDADIVATLGDRYVILIEDKTDTSEHSDQLPRYKKAISEDKRYHQREIIPFYIKTGEQSSFDTVKEAGWNLFLRDKLLSVLRPGKDIQNNFIRDFLAHLEDIEAAVNSFQVTPISSWKKTRAWEGFFQAVKKALGEGNWGYVPNASGGFMSFNWAWHKIEGGKLYLQLEDDQLVAKVEVKDSTLRSTIRNRWSKIVKSSSAFPFKRPARLGNGRWMTVAESSSDYLKQRTEGRLDFDATIDGLRMAAAAIADITTSVSSNPVSTVKQ